MAEEPEPREEVFGEESKYLQPLEQLKQAWRNETFAPEILDYEADAVKQLVEKTKANDEFFDEQEEELFYNQLRMMDNDRVKFVVRDYLRVRLKKIQEMFMFILNNPGQRQRLSEPELRFAEGLRKLFEEHCSRSALDRLPPDHRRLEVQNQHENMIPEPNMDQFVTSRVLTDIGSFQLSEEHDPTILKKDNVLVAKYSAIKNLLEQYQLRLI
eukprot:tig00021350_g20620.t1